MDGGPNKLARKMQIKIVKGEKDEDDDKWVYCRLLIP